MSGVSIYTAVRTAKVNSGNANQYQSMRIFDPSAQVCPVRSNVSDSGVVGVARDTIDTYGQANGCYSPLDRITVENSLRPRYAIYLNADAIDVPGVGDEDLMSSANPGAPNNVPYDTRFGNGQQFGQQLPGAQMRPTVKYSSMKPASAQVAGNAQLNEANQVSCFMSTVNTRQNCQLYSQ